MKLLLKARIAVCQNIERVFIFKQQNILYALGQVRCNTIKASLASQLSIRDYVRSNPLSGHQFTGP